MASGWENPRDSPLGLRDAERLAALRGARSLADLVELTAAGTEHEAYFAAKREWHDLRGRELAAAPLTDAGLPGTRVVVDGQAFHVHGITHAATEAERKYLLEHVAPLLDAGASVYCEQGVRSMYFDPLPDVAEMDDYRWAMAECDRRELDAAFPDLTFGEFDGIREEIDTFRSRFREATFALIESGAEVYGERFERALGDVASTFLLGREGMATGEDFEAFRRSRRAARDPSQLATLQRYYERSFLPQPVERVWLRRHDPKLELVTHARNERMADYAVYHADDGEPVHLIVGAAHQPGVAYYLRRHRDGDRSVADFALVE